MQVDRATLLDGAIMATFAYDRVSTPEQMLDNQRLEIEHTISFPCFSKRRILHNINYANL